MLYYLLLLLLLDYYQPLELFLIFQTLNNFLLKSTILQLIKNKLRELQNLVKYFNETKTSVSNLILSSVVLPNTFVLHSEDFLVVVLYVIYYKITSMIIFILIIIHFISIIIPLADFNSIKIFIAYKCFIDFCYA